MAAARIIVGASRRAANHQLRLLCHTATPTTHFRRLLCTRIDPDAEWFEAQKILLRVDLAASARQLLKFLAEIGRNRDLYEGPALHRAIYRYKNCWLPLLAKQSELAFLKRPLVVPLDCEWIWHVHRLNPKLYKAECEELYGRVLDDANVESTTQTTCYNHMKEIWNNMFLDEPFALDISSRLTDIGNVNCNNDSQKSTNYDLVSAVKRQQNFFHQVSRPFMNDSLFLKEAIARYKGFLHLIRKNKEESSSTFCVPTYDIDLIWHAHQLHPTFYCMDTTEIYGAVLEHDDSVTDRSSKDTKLNIGFMDTTKQWEELYGLRYWKAGAMFRGNAPSPLTLNDVPLKEAYTSEVTAKESEHIIRLPMIMQIEVLLELVEVRGIPEGQRDDLFVVISQKYQNNRYSPTKKKLSVSPKSMKAMKQVVSFQCEPTELLVELMSSTNTIKHRDSSKIIGSTTISFADIVNAGQELSVDRWFELFTPSETKDTKSPLSLRISLSFTPPVRAIHLLQMVNLRGYTSVIDEDGNSIIEIYQRCLSDTEKEIVGNWRSSGDSILAKNVGKGWCLMDSQWEFRPCNKAGNVYELLGERKVIFMPGKKLEYETKQNSNQDDLKSFITAIEFSPENPYGKAVALLDIKSGVLQIKEDWFLLPGVVSAYCLLHQALGWKYETKKDDVIDDLTFYRICNNRYDGDENTAENGDNIGGGDDRRRSSGGSCGGSCGGSFGGSCDGDGDGDGGGGTLGGSCGGSCGGGGCGGGCGG